MSSLAPRQPMRPGLAKAGRAPALKTRTVQLVSGSDEHWRDALERADIVSEGASRDDGEARTYYGSTNIVIAMGDRIGAPAELVAQMAALDPHLRLRAIRMARREAAQRARGPIESVRAEIAISTKTCGVVVHVEVEARVLPDRRKVPRDNS